MWPMLDSTTKPPPRYPAIVRAFAGDSTMTRVVIWSNSVTTVSRALRARASVSCARMARPPRPSWLYLLVAALSWPVLTVVFRLRSTGKENVPDGGCVLAANHWSNCDPLPLGLPLFPRRFLRFMAKKELFWPPLGWIVRAGGGFRVDRGKRDQQAIATAVALCRAGHAVVMFPEGTRRSKGLRKRH